ncbi:hypothetical protein B0H13DRAFT_2313385 [Mycena leptocephala]|nr:hypothetical protein B0H13DRAFT_2313385 [Mycena leptocephala]
MHGLDIPALPPPATRKKNPAAVPEVHRAPIPNTSTPLPNTRPPSQPSGSKRVHLTHNTRLDDAAPPSRRARPASTPQTPHMPYSPLVPRPTPISRYRGYVPPPPSPPSQASSSYYPGPSTPSPFLTPGHPTTRIAPTLPPYPGFEPSPFSPQPSYHSPPFTMLRLPLLFTDLLSGHESPHNSFTSSQ